MPVCKCSSTLRRVLRGLFFILGSGLLFKWIFGIALIGSWITEGGRDFVSSISTSIVGERVNHEWLQDIHNSHWHYDIPSDMVIDECIQGSEWSVQEVNGIRFHHSASTSFNLSRSIDNLFVVSRGWLSADALQLVTSSDQAKNTVTVTVRAAYHQEYARDLVKACLVHSAGMKRGIGIFVSQKYGSEVED